MERTLYDKAVENLGVAKMIHAQMGDDEIYLNSIGYHLQQAVEIAMKYILEQNGIEYPHTHRIEYLISLAEQNEVDLALTEYIDEHSEMLSSWEANTRYITSYNLERRKVEKALTEVSEYLNNVRGLF